LAGNAEKFDMTENLLYAASRGRGYLQQVLDILRLLFAGYKMSPEDYYYYGLYDSELYAEDDQHRFVSDRYFTKAILQTCDREWWAISNDKVVSYTLLHGAGVPVPSARAIYHPFRTCLDAQRLRSADEVADWLRDPSTPYPLFAKPVTGVQSLGQALLLGIDRDADTLELKVEGSIPVAEFAQRVVTTQGTSTHDGYLFQDVLEPHPELRALCGEGISTVRMIVLIDADGPRISHTTWKIVTGDHFADNFWRRGNMVADIDPETGEIRRVVRGYGLDLEVVTKHPDTRQELVGQTLPDWARAREMVLRCATLLPKVRFQGWDVGFCAGGPVVVEVNTGSSFTLAQIASARGFMTPEFRRFLDHAAKATKQDAKAEM